MSNRTIKIGHICQDKELKICDIPIEQGQVIYSEKSAMQFVDYAGKRHMYGSILCGVFNDTYIDFCTLNPDATLNTIKENGLVVNGQMVKIGNTIYQYRNINESNIIANLNSKCIHTGVNKACYVIYLPEFEDGDFIDIDLLISISNDDGDKIFYVKVEDNSLDLTQCEDVDGEFDSTNFIISITHDGNGMFILSTTVDSVMNIISCTVNSTGLSTHEEICISSSDLDLMS